MENLFHEEIPVVRKPDKEMFWYVQIPFTHKKFLYSWLSWQVLWSFTNTNALSLSLKKIKESLFTWLLTLILPAFVLTFLKIVSPHHLSTLVSNTLLNLIFEINFICPYLPADKLINLDKPVVSQVTLPYVTLLSHMSVSFPARHQTSSIKEEQLKRMLLHKGLPSFLFPFSGYDSTLMGFIKWMIIQLSSETTI